MHNSPSAAFFDHLFTPDCYVLHLAKNHSDIPSMLRILDAGHNIIAAHAPHGNSDGYGTALHIAIWRNQHAAFTTLLAHGANTDMLDAGSYNIRFEDTPIRLVVRLGRREMLKMLWDSGAQRAKYADDYPPYAIESGSLLEIAAWEGHADMVSDLIAWNEEWSLNQWSHALWLACGAFHGGVARVLLAASEYGQETLEGIAKYTVTSENAQEKLLGSREQKMKWRREEGKRHADVIKVLLEEHRGLITGRPQYHLHLLSRLLPMAATSPFRVDTLVFLLRGEADPNYRCENNGMTALLMALIIRRDVGRFNEEGVEALLEHRAKINLLDEAAKSKIEIWRRRIVDGS